MNFLLSNKIIYAIVGLSFLSLCAIAFYLGVVPLVLLLGALAGVAYYYNSIRWNGLLLYPIIAGVFLEGVLTLFDGSGVPLTLFQITFVVSFGVYVLISLYEKDLDLTVNHYIIPLLLFLCIISFSLIYSEDRVSGSYNTVRFLVLLIFVGFVTNLIKTREIIYRGFLVVIVVSLGLSLYSVFENVFNTEVAIQNFLSGGLKVERSSAGGIYNDPNKFAASLFLPLALGLAVMNSRLNLKYRVLGGIMFFIVIGGVFSSYSRSGFFGAVLIIGLNVILFNRIKPFAILSMLGLLVVLLVPDLRMSLFTYGKRIIELLTGNIDDSSSIRIMLAIGAIQMFIDSHLIGVGFDAFGENFTQYYSVQQTLGVYNPHNIIYRILAELGIHGFFVFAIIVWMLIKDSYQNVVKSKGKTPDEIVSITLLSTICAYLLFYQFYGGGLYDTALMLTIGLMLSHKAILDKELTL